MLLDLEKTATESTLACDDTTAVVYRKQFPDARMGDGACTACNCSKYFGTGWNCLTCGHTHDQHR
jgi:hypothetical protein